MRRTVLAFAFLGLVACKPPVTELNSPSVASMQGKAYTEVVPTMKLVSELGTETITAYLILPEIAVLSVEEQLKAKNAPPEDIALSREAILKRDELIFQAHFQGIKGEYVNAANWEFTLSDEAGRSAKGTVRNQTPPIQTPRSASGSIFDSDAQVAFDGFKIGTAKKLTLKANRKGGKAGTMTWVLPADRTPVAPAAPSSAPAAPAATPAAP